MIKWSGAPPEVIGTWRLLGASLLLFAFLVFKKRSTQFLKQLVPHWKMILLTGFFFFLHLWSYFYSAQNTKIANCMILFATNPLFTAAGSFLFFKEKLTKNLYFSYVLAFSSLYLLLSNTIEFNPENLKGEISGVVSAFFYSAYILSSKKARQGLDNGIFATGIYFTCGICFLALDLFKGTPLTGYSQQAWLGILGTIFIPTFLGHAIFTYLMNYLNINWMSCGKLLEPVMSALIAYLIFQENINSATKVSFLLTIMAVIILLYPKLFRRNTSK